MKKVFVVIAFLWGTNSAFSQEHSICNDAIPVNDASYGPVIPTGWADSSLYEKGNESMYLGETHKVIWFSFIVPFDTVLAFQIVPDIPTDDFDFMLFKADGGDFCRQEKLKKVQPIRANFAKPTEYNKGISGLSARGTEAFIAPGFHSPYSSVVKAKKGELYYIVVDNNESNKGGFTLKLPFMADIKSPVIKSNLDSVTFKKASLTESLPVHKQPEPHKDTVKHDPVSGVSANDNILQNDAVPKFKIGGYIDVYYARYTDSAGHGQPQKFGAIAPYSNNFGLNIAQLTGQYNAERLRATFTLQYGDLPTVAWSPVYNYIQEANAGVRLYKNLWLDAGFFKTHIGTEGLLPKDNICSSVSIITFYEPWWQSGVRLSWTGDKDKLYMALYGVNGYNQFVSTNNKKAAGLAVTYNFSDNFSVGYYNLMSDDTPDSIPISHWRLLNNLVINLVISHKLSALIGCDFIVQQNTLNGTGYAQAYSAIGTLKYQFLKKMAVYGRFEMFNDPQSFLAEPIVNFKLMGGTFGIEYKPLANSFIRLEGRELNMAPGENIFYSNGEYANTQGEIMLDMGIWF